ncbi:MAG: hypothetical protein IKX20_11170 [Paludibacteraceae bacterium]|nr:hypothetical protein [Paludibacteraceae bacterium]MBR6014719.1 hypothetical protein [Bacillota bacterium]
MLTAICAEIRNYFTYQEDKHPGTYKIENGILSPSVDLKTDYFAIFGSRKNNGVHLLSKHDLKDEGEFTGAVWSMSPPDDFLAVVADIEAWQDKYGGVDSEAQSPYYSESFGGYSYTKSAGSTSAAGNSAAGTWQSVYGDRLKIYRRIRL